MHDRCTPNLKLYCDEQRKWRLISGSIAIDGVVTISSGFNATKGQDLISRNDDGEWYLGVLIKYQWTDALGVQQTAYDFSGSATRVLVLEYDRPYPGPGGAAYVLGRAGGLGRVYDLMAISAYDAQPGMQLAATLPNSEIQVGVLSGVRWQFPQDEMSVKSRGLVTTPSTAWVFDAPGVSWASVPSGTSWTADI